MVVLKNVYAGLNVSYRVNRLFNPREALRRLFKRPLQWRVIIPPYEDGHVNVRCALSGPYVEYTDGEIAMPIWSLPHVAALARADAIGRNVLLNGRILRIVSIDDQRVSLYPIDYTMPGERTLPEDWLDHVITMPYYCLPHVDLHPNIVGRDVWLDGRLWRIVGANCRAMEFELYPLDDGSSV